MVANQMRPGSQHCPDGAAEFLERCVKIMADAGIHPRNCFRGWIPAMTPRTSSRGRRGLAYVF